MGNTHMDNPEDFEGVKPLTYSKIVSGLKKGEYKKIVIATGAGISTSAGIPDFRSENGLYNTLKIEELSKPEDLFNVDFFREKPEFYYRFMKNCDRTKYDPTPTHFFFRLLSDKNFIYKYMTQNVDNLEEKAGVNMKNVVQAHGVHKGAVCCDGHPNDEKKFQACLAKEEVYYCETCAKEGKKVPVKFKTVMFGQQLPQEFH